ncbi:MAG: sigma-70 family RNA polymerase sigma factor [Nocardioidaceae bacterium]|nr:sigma-70 family RNA polymerase sigma factor [Nocardioidaceae bacterium]NUS50556.1 sigma-70 family RNA polymerase sigma factor [Nocardioidaceae bacterium]
MASPATPSPTVGPVLTAEGRDRLVRENLPLVSYVVRDTLSRVPGHVSRDELMSAGRLALVQAVDGFDASRGASFTTYATTRIRGALVDELRSLDWASRSVRRRARQVDDARGRISAELGRPAQDHEVAAELGLGADELAAHKNDVERASVVSIHGMDEGVAEELLPADRVTPADLVEQREQVAYLHDAIDHLPERLRAVVEGYFFGDRPMADLAAELGVSESRISQLRAEAVGLLRGALVSALDPDRAERHERPDGCAARRKEAYYASVAAHRSYAARLSTTHVGGGHRRAAGAHTA